jgi:hypothetical protein
LRHPSVNTKTIERNVADGFSEPKKKLLYYLKVMQQAGLVACATFIETDNDLRERVWGGDDPCDTVVDVNAVFGDICTAWLLIDEY